MIKMSTVPRKRMAIRKMEDRLGLMKKHITMLQISMRGARTATRRIICQAFWILVTSVVIRVTSPAVLYLSMLEKEKSCTFS